MVSANCSAHESLRAFFLNGDFVDGWLCSMTGGDVATQLMLFALIFGGIELALFISTRSVIQPAIIAILFGGVMFGLLPATLPNLALVALLLLGGALGLLVAFRSGS